MELIIIVDKTWVYEFDMQTNQYSLEWRQEANQNRKKHDKVGQVSTLFSLIFVAWCTMNSLMRMMTSAEDDDAGKIKFFIFKLNVLFLLM